MLPAEGEVLDIGSGTGHWGSEILAQTNLKLREVDIADTNTVGREPIIFDGQFLPFEENEFSGVSALYCIHYPPDPSIMIKECFRVSTGKVIILSNITYKGIRAWLIDMNEFIGGRIFHAIGKFFGVFKVDNPMVPTRQLSEPQMEEIIQKGGGEIVSVDRKGFLFITKMYVIEPVHVEQSNPAPVLRETATYGRQ